MTHRNNGHETAAYLMQTAHAPGERLAYPSLGAVFAHFKSPGCRASFHPVWCSPSRRGGFFEEVFLGAKLKPFATGGDPNAVRFEVEGVISRGIPDARQMARRELLGKMDTMGAAMAASPQLAAAAEVRELACNDDCEDLTAGTNTHHGTPIYEEGLLTDVLYAAKVTECEAGQ